MPALRPIRNGEPVEIYWNLHRDCYSVRVKGRVVAYVDAFILTDAKFSSQKKGRMKVRQRGRKNVHAFIRGRWSDQPVTATTRITYNPYTDESFVVADAARTPIFAADVAVGGYRYNGETPVALVHVG